MMKLITQSPYLTLQLRNDDIKKINAKRFKFRVVFILDGSEWRSVVERLWPEV